MTLVRKAQPFDPTDPEPDFANAVHATLFERLGLVADQVYFYTAVNSPLDYKGTDGWFEVHRPNRGMTYVTVDLTTNPNKADGYKADIVFLVPAEGLDRRVDRKEFKEFIEYTNKLVDLIIEELERLELKYG